MVNRYIYFILLMPFVTSCKETVVSPEELNRYVADESNGLRKLVSVGPSTIEVTYRPTDLLVLQEVKNSSPSQQQIEVARTKYDKYLYFILSLSINDREALQQVGGSEYSELVQTFSFRMNNYVTLTTAVNDTIPVADFMLDRTFGMSSSTDILFVFNREKAKGKTWVQFNLNEFGLGTGNQRFRFDTNEINDVPAINFAAHNQVKE